MTFDTRRLPDTPLLPAALAFIALTMLAAMPATAQTPAATIEDADGQTLWQLNEDGGFALFGAYDLSGDAGAVPAEGEGARLMWYPAKAAFRAGYVSGTHWDDGNVGRLSTAMGRNTTASGYWSTAMGHGTTASGLWSTAMGSKTTASGDWSTAIGLLTTAASGYSLSIGRYNSANSTYDNTLFVAGNGDIYERSDALVLDRSGNLTIAGSLSQSSDRRLKTAIAPLEAGVLEKLLAIRAVRYHFRDTTRHPAGAQIGLLAQEVQQQFPALVSEGTDSYLSVSYSKLTAVLLKGLQEQQAQIEGQQIQIGKQQAQIDSLRDRVQLIESLQARIARLEARPTRDAGRAGWSSTGALLLCLLLGSLLGTTVLRTGRR